jgi:hypothetical protein
MNATLQPPYPGQSRSAETVIAAPPIYKRISWGAIAAGVVLAIALQMVLALLGAGLGLSSIDPLNRSTPDASTLGIGAGAWWAVSSAVALFVAGAVAAHLSSSVEKTEATLHGLLTWAIVVMFTAYLLASLIGSLARGAAGVAGTAATVTASGVAAAAGPATDMAKRELEAQGISLDTIKNEARKLLTQTGKPDLQPGAVAAKASEAGAVAASAPATGDFDGALQRLVRAGKDTVSQVDRDAVVNVVMARANLSRADAEVRVDGWISSYQQAQAKFNEQKVRAEQSAREAADTAARASSQAALGAVVALVIGAIAATVGGLFGRVRRNFVPLGASRG